MNAHDWDLICFIIFSWALLYFWSQTFSHLNNEQIDFVNFLNSWLLCIHSNNICSYHVQSRIDIYSSNNMIQNSIFLRIIYSVISIHSSEVIAITSYCLFIEFFIIWFQNWIVDGLNNNKVLIIVDLPVWSLCLLMSIMDIDYLHPALNEYVVFLIFPLHYGCGCLFIPWSVTNISLIFQLEFIIH